MPLTPVQETLFFPLMGRADSARRWPELFADPWAEQAARIRSAAGSSAEQLGRGPAMVYGLRHPSPSQRSTGTSRSTPGRRW
ncbi:hypothetical protein BRM1_00540 [Brevibacterium sp. BRM-1]|uniref:hypothetical protein n=1 Tax=Brevibacterium sp. BRM-1 TaxID=2999062 RepID=UPI002280C25B|nr:hypothetical protein [Brevibacterium sp. BRM-1]WAL40400.1 hypothetical protein BRM1_00540 [Brevibacterium sp. BRM-1]